jgi:hypothetical protein
MVCVGHWDAGPESGQRVGEETTLCSLLWRLLGKSFVDLLSKDGNLAVSCGLVSKQPLVLGTLQELSISLYRLLPASNRVSAGFWSRLVGSVLGTRRGAPLQRSSKEISTLLCGSVDVCYGTFVCSSCCLAFAPSPYLKFSVICHA